MANVRCPMCSKLNPPEAEVCSYCGARLKPLRLQQSGQQPEGKDPAKSDEPDWLSQLREDRPGSLSSEEPGKPEETLAEEGEVPDWLSRIRDRAKTETGGREEELDWMKGLQSEAPSEQGVDDWLSRIPGGQAPGPAEQTPPAQPPAGSQPSGQEEEGADDWMNKLSAWQAGQNEQPPQEGASAPGPADEFGWLNEPSQAPPGRPDRSFFSGSGVTDFLHSLDQLPEEPQSTGIEPPGEGSPQEGAPQWGGAEWLPSGTELPGDQESSGYGLTGFLSSLDKPGAPQEQPGEMDENAFPGLEQPAGAPSLEGMPDWFSSEPSGQEAAPSPFTMETGEDLPAANAPVSGGDESDLAGWLKSLGNEAPDQPPAGELESAEGEAGIPDWLKGAAEASPFVQSEPVPFEGEAENLPDWLGSLEKEEETSSASEPVSPFTQLPEESEAGRSGLPAWLSGDFASTEKPSGAAEEPAAQTPGQAEPPLAGGEGLPDWFASFEQSDRDVEKTQPSRTGQLQPPEAMRAEPAGEQKPAAPAEPATAGEEGTDIFSGVPDWLQQFQSQQQPETGEGILPLAGEEEEEPSPLVGAGLFTSAPGDQGLESGDQPFTVDLPEWLGEDAAARQVEDAERPEEMLEGDEQLAQAELPEWVKEMRPLESIQLGEGGQAEVDQRVEKSGPLAGMRGVLPADEAATRYRKPPIYSVKLRVTEKQRTQQTLLESILSQESQPLLIPPERSRATGLVGRLLLALALVFVLTIPVIFPVNALAMPSPSPALFPAENQMYKVINQNLQANAPVLVAVDFEPALSGEMRLAAGPVIDQLVAKNARIVLISTTPSGPALGQQLLEDATTDTNYLADRTVNLGYLPGGAIALLDFAQQPSVAAPFTIDYRPAWTDTFLKNISGLGGFSQIIVLTDRDEIGRAWVEQVQPQLGKVPLLMVTSAQAAPLLQPYYQSEQIAGLTSGMLGGAIYSQLTGQSNNRTLFYFSAYQIGVVLAFGITLVGGLVSAGVSLFKRKDREEE